MIAIYDQEKSMIAITKSVGICANEKYGIEADAYDIDGSIHHECYGEYDTQASSGPICPRPNSGCYSQR